MTEEEFTKYLKQRLPDWSSSRLEAASKDLYNSGLFAAMMWDGKGKRPLYFGEASSDAWTLLNVINDLRKKVKAASQE